jgi:hypothetical protein
LEEFEVGVHVRHSEVHNLNTMGQLRFL